MHQRSISIAAIAWIAAILPTLAHQARADDDPPSTTQTTPAPTPDVSSADRASYATFDPSAHAGKVLYVDFWASWCGPCKHSFPFMKELAGRFPSDRFEVIGINLDKDRAKADRFLEQVRPNFATVFDPEGRLAAAYEIEGMPTTLLFDRTGMLRSVRVGYRGGEWDEIISEIESLIAEEPPRESND